MSPLEWVGIGLAAMGSAVVALVFLRFWHQSRDRFFLYFAAAFALTAVERMPEAFSPGLRDEQPWLYGMRLLAYGLIVFAIWQKNRR